MQTTNEVVAAPAEPRVGIIMGSRSDLSVMQNAADMLTSLQIPFEMRIVSAHRTPEWMLQYAQSAHTRGLEVIVAAAGGAAHLPGMVAACTHLPVLGVPIAATGLAGIDALLSIVQMPRGVPVGTLAIGAAGAVNAALLAARILALNDAHLAVRLQNFQQQTRDRVLADTVVG